MSSLAVPDWDDIPEDDDAEPDGAEVEEGYDPDLDDGR